MFPLEYYVWRIKYVLDVKQSMASEDDFILVVGLDQKESDIECVRVPIQRLKEIARSNDRCVAFNSLGFLKSDANHLVKSQYIVGGNGIFIRKSYMEKIASGEIEMHPESIWTAQDAELSLVSHGKKKQSQSLSIHELQKHFEFFPNNDSNKSTLYYKLDDLASMLQEAFLDPSVVAVNTRGEFKHIVASLVHLPGPQTEGIYIKKRYLTSLQSSLRHLRPRKQYTLDSFFDKIFVINVASSTERWSQMVQMLHANNITNYERVEAITPATMVKYGWKWPTAHKFREGLTHSSLGVQLAIKLSNWLCMCLGKERNYERFLILEDDAKIAAESVDKISDTLASLEQSCPDWDMFYLFGLFYSQLYKVDENISKIKGSCSCVAYALSRRRLDYIIEQVAMNLSEPVDDILCNIVGPNVNVYMSNPMIFAHDFSVVSHVPHKKIEPKTRRVKMLCDWQDSLSLCQEFSTMCQYDFRYNYLEFTHEDHDIDYYLIICRPRHGDTFDPARTIVCTMEPSRHIPGTHFGTAAWGEWARPDPAKFLEVISHDRYLNAGQIQCDVSPTFPSIRKDRVMTIVSAQNTYPGHKMRPALIRYAYENGYYMFNVFGRHNYHNLPNYCPLTHDRKEFQMREYKYFLAIENVSEHNYATEKIWEPIVNEMLCFYWGCPNILEYIDPEAIVLINPLNMRETCDIMQRAIAENWHAQRLPAIRRAKEKILREILIFPRIEKIIETFEAKQKLQNDVSNDSTISIGAVANNNE